MYAIRPHRSFALISRPYNAGWDFSSSLNEPTLTEPFAADSIFSRLTDITGSFPPHRLEAPWRILLARLPEPFKCWGPTRTSLETTDVSYDSRRSTFKDDGGCAAITITADPREPQTPTPPLSPVGGSRLSDRFGTEPLPNILHHDSPASSMGIEGNRRTEECAPRQAP